jgi:hypothetical protein
LILAAGNLPGHGSYVVGRATLESKNMRLVLIGLAAAGALLATASPGAAQWGRGTYCTQPSLFSDDMSFPDCRYYSYEQCRGTASGTGLSCIRNPYAEPSAPARRARASARKKTRR